MSTNIVHLVAGHVVQFPGGMEESIDCFSVGRELAEWRDAILKVLEKEDH